MRALFPLPRLFAPCQRSGGSGDDDGYDDKGDDDDNGDGDDIYIMMSVCVSQKIITSSWESPVTTQVGFSLF